LHGNGQNLWFDKSITYTCSANGNMGINAEHSWADGAVTAHLSEELSVIEHLLVKYNAEDGKIIGDTVTAETSVKCLTWTNLT